MKITKIDVINLIVRTETLLLNVINTDYKRMLAPYAENALFTVVNKFDSIAGDLKDTLVHITEIEKISKVNAYKLTFYSASIILLLPNLRDLIFSIISTDEDKKDKTSIIEYLHVVYNIGQYISNTNFNGKDDITNIINTLNQYEEMIETYGNLCYRDYIDTVLIDAIFKNTDYWKGIA